MKAMKLCSRRYYFLHKSYCKQIGRNKSATACPCLFLFIVPSLLNGDAPVHLHQVRHQSAHYPSDPCSAGYSILLIVLSFQPVPLLLQKVSPALSWRFRAVSGCLPTLHEPPQAFREAHQSRCPSGSDCQIHPHPALLCDATEKVVSLVSQGVKYVQKCSLIIKFQRPALQHFHTDSPSERPPRVSLGGLCNGVSLRRRDSHTPTLSPHRLHRRRSCLCPMRKALSIKSFYKTKFLCQNAFTFLCLTRKALIYLPLGSMISNTAPVSPLYARIVPLCMWMISRVRARPMPDFPLFPM